MPPPRLRAVPDLRAEDLTGAAAELAPVVCAVLTGPGTGRSELPAAVVSTLATGVAELTRHLLYWAGPTAELERTNAEERRLLAREIHDWFGSTVSLALRRLDLYEMNRQLGASASIAEADLRQVRSALADAVGAARSLVSGLRCAAPEAPLAEALRSYARAAETSDVQVEVVVNGDEHLLTSSLRAELFAVVREGLRNALAHSRAANVAVRIDITDAMATALVEDDGIGLPEATADDPASSGLASMRERAELLGAEFRVTRRPAAGTRLSLRIPIVAETDEYAC
jgi:signal transduction histidine kinase